MTELPDFTIDNDQALIIDTLRELADVRDEIKTKEAALDEIKRRRRELEETANTLMQNAGVGRIEVDGRLFSPSERRYYSINKQEQQKAYDFLHAVGLEWLIQETVNSRSLTSQLISHVKEGGEVPTDLFNVRVDKAINMRT